MFNDKLNQIVNILKRDKNIFGIGLVGSYVIGNNFNDIDFLVVTKNIKKSIVYLTKKFKLSEVYINDDSLRIKNYMEYEIGIGLDDKKQFDKKIFAIVNGINVEPVYKNWNIVGWLLECLLYDINNMKILYEKKQLFTKVQKKIELYPKKLKEAIIKECNIKLFNLNNRKNKAGDIERSIIESEIVSLKIRKQFCKENNINLSSNYFDDGITGLTFEREGWNQLIDTIKQGKVDCVITKDLSRLGRDHSETGYYIEKFFPENDVRYISINDNWEQNRIVYNKYIKG